MAGWLMMGKPNHPADPNLLKMSPFPRFTPHAFSRENVYVMREYHYGRKWDISYVSPQHPSPRGKKRRTK
ncbi:MAG: hypothetical protein ABI162_12395, partial [Luteolibacter sp.]